jgi:hypothetical protein
MKITLYRYFCECGKEFKINYKEEAENIEFCPFCGRNKNDGFEVVICNGEFKAKLIEDKKGEEKMEIREKIIEKYPKTMRKHVKCENCLHTSKDIDGDLYCNVEGTSLFDRNLCSKFEMKSKIKIALPILKKANEKAQELSNILAEAEELGAYEAYELLNESKYLTDKIRSSVFINEETIEDGDYEE